MPSVAEAYRSATTWRPGGREPENWRLLGICSQEDEDPDLWSDPRPVYRRAAQHRCRAHCLVIEICAAFVTGSSGVVVGGVAHGERNAKPLKHDPLLARERCPRCPRH